MITPITFVKITRMLRRQGDRDRKRYPAWAVTVERDSEWFLPAREATLHSMFGQEPYVFDWEEAVAWARKVARIVDSTSIQCFDGTGEVLIYERELDDES